MKATFVLLITLLISGGCQQQKKSSRPAEADSTMYANPLLDAGAEPWVTYHEGYYYYTQGAEAEISLWKTQDLTDLRTAERKVIYTPDDENSRYHLWAPELHYIDRKWYLYYTADNGNTDNHQIYVAENVSDDPMKGSFVCKGHLSTDKENNWAIHPSTFFCQGKQYLIWSGWKHRRIKAETQYIYIAEMENPWTLASERVAISTPEHEWELQWVNPDGNKSAYPIYVNENPQVFITPYKVILYYGASGSWTPYYCVGKLEADLHSDLLDPRSWKKAEQPVFMQNPRDSVFSPGGVCFIQSPRNGEWYMLYHARKIPNDSPGDLDSRTPRMQPVRLNADGELCLGIPVSTDSLLTKP